MLLLLLSHFSHLTLRHPMDCSLPGFPVPGILQARVLEWGAIAFSNAWKWKVKVKSLSRVRLLATPWTTAHQALRPWDFPGKSTGVGCHCLLQRRQCSYSNTFINELSHGFLQRTQNESWTYNKRPWKKYLGSSYPVPQLTQWFKFKGWRAPVVCTTLSKSSVCLYPQSHCHNLQESIS